MLKNKFSILEFIKKNVIEKLNIDNVNTLNKKFIIKLLIFRLLNTVVII